MAIVNGDDYELQAQRHRNPSSQLGLDKVVQGKVNITSLDNKVMLILHFEGQGLRIIDGEGDMIVEPGHQSDVDFAFLWPGFDGDDVW